MIGVKSIDRVAEIFAVESHNDMRREFLRDNAGKWFMVLEIRPSAISNQFEKELEEALSATK